MKALILAAGRGRRLWPFTAEVPKCLLPLGNSNVLGHQLDCLQSAGASQVTVVCGFGAEAVGRYLESYGGPMRLRTLYNPFYAVSDNLISLWAARSEMDGPFVLLNGDNVFDRAVLGLLGDGDECLLLGRRKDSYQADDMKISLASGRVCRLGKEIPPESTDAESVGIMGFSAEGARRLRTALEEAVKGERALNSYFVSGIQALSASGYAVCYRDIGPLFWTDIDTPNDLRLARDRYPLIAAFGLDEKTAMQGAGGPF